MSGKGASSLSDCQPCPHGLACLVEGLVNPFDSVSDESSDEAVRCAAGFYCEYGTNTAVTDDDSEEESVVAIVEQYPCEAGYECPADSFVKKICQPGTYQPLTQQESCEECPAGSYCDGEDPTSSQVCPAGSYCPLGTKHGEEFPCPAGYFNEDTGGTSKEESCQ